MQIAEQEAAEEQIAVAEMPTHTTKKQNAQNDDRSQCMSKSMCIQAFVCKSVCIYLCVGMTESLRNSQRIMLLSNRARKQISCPVLHMPAWFLFCVYIVLLTDSDGARERRGRTT